MLQQRAMMVVTVSRDMDDRSSTSASRCDTQDSRDTVAMD